MKKSGLCMYCLKHAAELECYGRGGPGKPKCPQPECGEQHTTGAHKLLGEVNASINLVAGEDYESDEDEEWWVNVVRVEEEGENLQEFIDPGLEGSEEEAENYCLSICIRKDDSGLEDEMEYCRDVIPPPEADEDEEDRWWSPGPQEPGSKEGDEEENRYLISLLMGEPKGESNGEEAAPPQDETEAGLNGEDHQAPAEELERRGEGPPGGSHNEEPPTAKKFRRRGLRKGKMTSRDEEWETARHDAWLGELLTDSSEGESEDGCWRFVESGRWIAEMTESRDRGLRRQEGGKTPEI